MKLGTETGSVMNHLMSGCPTPPVVNKGATMLHWTDRSPYDVVWVSDDQRKCLIRACDYRFDNTKEGGMGHQNWIIESVETNTLHELNWKNGVWKQTYEERVFTKSAEARYDALYADETMSPSERNDEIQKMHNDESNYRTIRRSKKINIIFGVRNYYYDWSF